MGEIGTSERAVFCPFDVTPGRVIFENILGEFQITGHHRQ